MPLSHSQAFESFGCGGVIGHSIQGHCQKRKLGAAEVADTERFVEVCDWNEDLVSHPKRKRQWSSHESQTQEFHQNESHSGEVNMEEDRDCAAANERHPSGNDSSDLQHSNCKQVQDSCSTMESDFVPDESHYVSAHTAKPASPPQNIIMQGGLRRGLKPSPVSGRLYCHCSASWRGMYGLDTGYITDYY